MTPFSHVFSCAVRWGDMDAYGHVNHTQFLRYLESARVALFEELCGAALPTLVVAEVRCRYLAELRYPATITVHSAAVWKWPARYARESGYAQKRRYSWSVLTRCGADRRACRRIFSRRFRIM